MTWVTITGAGTTTATKFHGDAMNKISNMFNGTDVTDTVTINSAVTWTFKGTALRVEDSDASHSYIFSGSDLAADRTITLPLLAGNDTLVTEAHSATLTNKTVALGSNTVSGTFAQFNTAVTDETLAGLGTAQTFTALQSFSSIDLVGSDADNIQNLIHDISTSGTDIDFSEDELQEISISANTTFTGTNYATGKSKAIKITTDATERTLTFPSGWAFIGTKPTSQVASKTGVLSLTCFSGVEAGVVASYAVQE